MEKLSFTCFALLPSREIDLSLKSDPGSRNIGTQVIDSVTIQGQTRTVGIDGHQIAFTPHS